MRLITSPIRLLVRTAVGAVVVPLKVLLATAGFTFRADRGADEQADRGRDESHENNAST